MLILLLDVSNKSLVGQILILYKIINYFYFKGLKPALSRMLIVLILWVIRRRISWDVHDWGSKEILQCHEEVGLKSSAKTHTKTQGTMRYIFCVVLKRYSSNTLFVSLYLKAHVIPFETCVNRKIKMKYIH